MRKLLARTVLVMVAVTSGVAIVEAAAPDPAIGTWRLNVSKSTFSPGPPFKSQTRTYSQSGHSITLVAKTVDADGKETTIQTTYQLDGTDYPVTGTPNYDRISGKQVASNTADFTLKKADKAVATTSRTVSKDGRTLTLKAKGTTAKGDKYDDVLVFDKQ